MAKNMAKITNGMVTNIIWCADGERETDGIKDIYDRPVGIGDTYRDGDFYRNGQRILTQLEQAHLEIQHLKAEKAQLETAYREGVNSI